MRATQAGLGASNPGKGSKFWFNLALEACEAPKDSFESLEKTTERFPSGLSQVRVLIAEDNKTNQLITSRYLKHFGCEFEIANNGMEAVEKVMMHDFDIILMDISMPELNGYEATAKIRSIADHKKSTLPIIAFTAYASKEDQQKILDAGMDGFIPKPFSRQHIPDFDLSVLDSIVEDMEPEAVSNLFNEFHKDVERYLLHANDGLKQENTALLEKASHGIQGVSGMFGAHQLSELAKTRDLLFE